MLFKVLNFKLDRIIVLEVEYITFVVTLLIFVYGGFVNPFSFFLPKYYQSDIVERNYIPLFSQVIFFSFLL